MGPRPWFYGGGVESVDIVIIGAGQAGLAVGYHLRRAARRWARDGRPGKPPSFVLLDAESRPGGSWQHYWDSLRIFTPAGMSSLPGMLMSQPPGGGNPRAADVVDYFSSYEDRYDLPVVRATPALSVTRGGPGFVVDTPRGQWGARVVVSATGTWTNPHIPRLPGSDEFAGRICHTVDYRTPEEFAGQRVMVVGAGNSGAQIAADLTDAAEKVWWATTEPPELMPDGIGGRELFAHISRWLAGEDVGTIPGSIVATGPVRRARDRGLVARVPMPKRLTQAGAVWPGGAEERVDAVILCTGFRPSLGYLEGLEEEGLTLEPHPATDEAQPTRSTEIPGLYFVGYGQWTGAMSATIVGVGRSAKGAARAVLDDLAPRGTAS